MSKNLVRSFTVQVVTVEILCFRNLHFGGNFDFIIKEYDLTA